MNPQNASSRRPGWGVRPLNWNDCDNEDSDNDEILSTEEVNHFESLEIPEGMEANEFAKWVSMKWNLVEFDGTKPVSERKNEWERFSDQFTRIISIRRLSSSQKLQALQLQAGQYLNDILKIQRKRGMCTVDESYEKVISDLNDYFDQTCDVTQERSKFREMKMVHEESFVDFELRCEKQIRYCNFSKEQSDEEMTDALLRRSIPEISKPLRLLAPTFQNDTFAIIKHGTHLDNIRKEEATRKLEEEAFVKPVMSVERESNRYKPRYAPYNKRLQSRRDAPRNWVPKGRSSEFSKRVACGKCSEYHQFGNCPAKGRKCMKCGRWGHYARCCKATPSGNHESGLKNEVKDINQVKFEKENENRSNISSDEEN